MEHYFVLTEDEYDKIKYYLMRHTESNDPEHLRAIIRMVSHVLYIEIPICGPKVNNETK